MTAFSASDAALEGFNLLRRRWRVTLGWAAFNLLSLIMIVVASAMLSLVATAAAGSATAGGPVMTAAGAVVLALVLLAQAIIANGVFRLELRPDEPSFLHLRIGGAELRLVLIWLMVATGAWVLGWAGVVVAHAAGRFGVVADLLAWLAILYLSLRFALVAPSSFAEGRIDFPRSWTLTRGRTLALLGMSALSLCLIAMVMAALLVALVLVALAIGGVHALSGVFGGAEALKAHPGVFLLGFAVQIVLTPVLWMLAMAPLAAAYRAFAAAKDEG